MEKSGGSVGRSFRYDPYHHPPPPHQYVAHPAHHPHHSIHQESTKITPYGEQSKHPPRTSEKGSSSREPEGGKCPRRCCRGIAHGLCSNIGVCALLLSYTLLGSFIFMAIEGGVDLSGPGQPEAPTPRRLNGSSSSPGGGIPPASPSSSLGSSPWLLGVSAGPRERTVESIWDITVSLNILYRENWTRLAAEEVAKFQEFLVQRLAEEWGPPPTRGGPLPARPLGSAGMVRDAPHHHGHHEWNFARAFLYSLTVLTTIGYGSVSPRTALGKTVTMAYAALGIPLMLLYLSCIGGLFSRGARALFGAKHRRRRSGSESSGGGSSSRESSCFHACCCCCASPRTERKPRSQKQQKSSAANNGAGGASSASVTAASVTTTVSNPPADVTATVRRSRGYLAASAGAAAEYREKLRALSPSGGGDDDLKGVEDGGNSTTAATACCSSGTSSAASPSATSSCATSPSASHASLPAPSCFRSFGLAGPLLLCMVAVILYVAAGAAVLARWERWPFLDAAYFCFMSLSTIGFGDMVPGTDHFTPFHGPPGGVRMGTGNATIWFVSLYILTGMALTATCFNILHDEIMQRLKHKYPSDAPALHSKSPGSSSGTVGAIVSASGGGGGGGGGGGIGGGMVGAASTTTTAVSTSSSVRKEGDEDPYS
ncbi:uncharacterized protein LOC124156550 [Ischnura elegans]|uniref:uncharacterized protein LOC124156550 n=1 Tax=Ischnura elegans TaxID=197161 RepID=UPI001ED8927C|nr:uncharacterized protein LOC124156550 [Ischnura elegans]